ncbi:DNA repair protein RecO [Paroceanicella profunda]|uniref:DNA repair protein RecO n=1 Tax=Paroceanicella profunda TaxID=2579971 RepID=A0A5B8FZS5_9RHOB|nr:DNA repair protein RecO [Paroceanicella profunda]QDL92192.1 DNA repair protein RecO [Paroceanicella profunda]
MEWQDEGVLIAMRRHGESAAIIEVFTAGHGRHAGLVPGGGGRRMAPVLQTGAQLSVTWRARVEDALGTYRVEPVRARAADLLQNADALAGLTATAALLSWALPEREAHPELYARSLDLFDALAGDDWPVRYAVWELELLAELGFGLDLTACALTGATQGLAYVSPRSGRAVTRSAVEDAAARGEPWVAKLLPLPGFLLEDAKALPQDIARSLALSGHFLDTWLRPALDRPGVPDARARLAARLTRAAAPGQA